MTDHTKPHIGGLNDQESFLAPGTDEYGLRISNTGLSFAKGHSGRNNAAVLMSAELEALRRENAVLKAAILAIQTMAEAAQK